MYVEKTQIEALLLVLSLKIEGNKTNVMGLPLYHGTCRFLFPQQTFGCAERKGCVLLLTPSHSLLSTEPRTEDPPL